jgi:hypothetical protein
MFEDPSEFGTGKSATSRSQVIQRVAQSGHASEANDKGLGQ